MMYDYVCIIPARKNSKRLKNKNFKIFNNKKLIEHTIIAAKKSGLFKRIILSSDSKQIEELANKYSVSMFRRDKFVDKISSVGKATIYTLKKMELEKNFNNVVQLMPTCPHRNSQDIKKSIKNFEKHKIKFQVSCFKFSPVHFNWALIKQKNKIDFFFKNLKKFDNNKIYYPTGAIWIANIKSLLKKKNFYNRETKYFQLNWINAIDIDTLDDFKIAKYFKKIK